MHLVHLVHLVNDRMDVSRINRNELRVNMERLDVASLIGTAREIGWDALHPGQRHLTMDLPAGPLHVLGDRVRLTQAIANLLENAAKFTAPEGQVVLRVSAQDNRLEIRVQDDGAGIAPARLSAIVEMFAQAEPGKHEGLGVGLDIVRNVVTIHDGSVRAESAGLGLGATFTIALPLLAHDSEDVPVNEIVVVDPTLRPRVLVVDDNCDIAESLSFLLSLHDVEVRVAYDGLEAIHACEDWHPTHILMDLGMPGMDGYEASRRLVALYPDRSFKLVALSGWGQDEDRGRTREAGFDLHLVKPVAMAALKVVLFS